MAVTITIDQISHASDAVWDALCVLEDTRDRATAIQALGTVSAEDRRLFLECAEDYERKLAREAAMEEALAERQHMSGIVVVPQPRYREPSASDAGPDYEGMILARQEADPSWWG